MAKSTSETEDIAVFDPVANVKWLLNHGMNDELIAGELGVHGETIRRLRRGDCGASYANARKIQQLVNQRQPQSKKVATR